MPASEPQSVKEKATAFVVFGATGDLSRKKIFPSFFELFKTNLLPEKFKIIAAARSAYSNKEFTQSLKENIEADDKNLWRKFSDLIEYIQCDVESGKNINLLSQRLEDLEKTNKVCTQRIFYMAVSPFIYGKAFENLGKYKLNLGCLNHQKLARIVTEKPFGFNFQSAHNLNEILNKYFDESQIFRIDHFLGKETVQNIFAFRFGNEIFEPIWNRNFVDNVQITLAERIGIEKRGESYDKMGALRDVVQNHLLQLLTIVTMDEPTTFSRDSIRHKKIEILKAIRPFSKDDVINNTIRGQYNGYQQEANVAKNSKTDTFALVKLFIENGRWQGVPFYLRTGKKLTGAVTSIIFQFKEHGHELFKNFQQKPIPNHITLQIQPDEGIGISLVAKKPGLTTVLEPVDMEFCYKKSFDVPQPNAYERLLMDIILGDQTLFLGRIGNSWKIIDPIEKVWQKGNPKLEVYEQGSWGPQAADKLIAADGRQWLAPLLTICKI